MYEQIEKPKENKSRAVANPVAQKKSNGKYGFGLEGNRPLAIIQRKLKKLIDNKGQVKYSQDNDPEMVRQCSSAVQRQLLPIARHREIVVDAAKRLKDPVKASDTEWIQAIYKELDGLGNPAASKCVDKLIEQRLIDQNDWDLIEKDFKLYRASKGKGLDVYERHNIPSVHTEEEANKWVASLIANRIDELYTTLRGFDGHAQQVQLSITSLVRWYKEGKFNKNAFDKYKEKIILSLKIGKSKSKLAIPDYVYHFEDNSTVTI